jgi:hypothetical protein
MLACHSHYSLGGPAAVATAYQPRTTRGKNEGGHCVVHARPGDPMMASCTWVQPPGPVCMGGVPLTNVPRVWLRHHRALGISRFCISLEEDARGEAHLPPPENSAGWLDYLQSQPDVFAEVAAAASQGNHCPGDRPPGCPVAIHHSLMDRQMAFVNRSLALARTENWDVDWLFHVDADELLHGDLRALDSFRVCGATAPAHAGTVHPLCAHRECGGHVRAGDGQLLCRAALPALRTGARPLLPPPVGPVGAPPAGRTSTARGRDGCTLTA